ncbi:MAG: hypothetical protein ACRDD8_06495 [Bacteroidales bacterium]
MSNPNWEYISVDTNSMESGKFYEVFTNADNATLVLPKQLQDDINSQVETNKQDIVAIKGKDEFQDIQIQELLDSKNENLDLILDNQRRINNLENTSLDYLLRFIDKLSIRKEFTESTHIEVEHNRKFITSVRVLMLISNVGGIKRYQDITNGVLKEEIIDTNTGMKKVILKPNEPITGYCLIL